MLEEKCPARPLEGLLDDSFADARLKGALVDVIVSAYEVEHRVVDHAR